jgi:hypothetical protein
MVDGRKRRNQMIDPGYKRTLEVLAIAVEVLNIECGLLFFYILNRVDKIDNLINILKNK